LYEFLKEVVVFKSPCLHGATLLPELQDDDGLNLNETLAKVVGLLTRRRWWILLPFCCVALAAIGVLSVLPNRYTSTATLLVVQQQVPQRYVVPNSETDVTSALQAMEQEVLSRTQLLRMIDDFGLYPVERKRLAPEQLIELMTRNIEIAPVSGPQGRNKDFDSFKISFTTENALTAQRVTNNLTSLFINEYLRTGAEHATNTTSFLHQQVEEKGKELEAQESRLRDFKLGHIGELPEQQPGNLGILTGLQNQLQNTMASLNRAQQQRALLQAQLEATPRRRPGSDFSVPVGVPGDSNSAQFLNPMVAAQNDLARLEAEKSKLLSKGYTAQHPDVARNRREIAEAADRLRHLRASTPLPESPSTTPATTTVLAVPETAEDPAVAQLKSALGANRLEIESLGNDEKRLKAQIALYENRINQTPVREQQQGSIVRDTEVLRQQYSELLKKEQESQLATNLEKQQGGQQFRLIDPASLPAVPSSPKRVKISLGGAAAGLALGFALAFLMELRDTSFHTESDLKKYLDSPFVLGLPLVSTHREERRRKWWSVIQWGAASAMVLVVLAAEFFVYRRG
jgi:succinoglycan biosynthesis transport protein ExoP